MKKIIVLTLALICTLGVVGCTNNKETINNSAIEAYSAFLTGDRTLLTAGWEIPDFQGAGFEFEYTYLDLDGDGVVELLVQLQDNPCGYNGAFHFGGEQMLCWNSDSVEGSCRDYPLCNGIMVRQYDYSGTRGYKLFRYKSNGETENISNLFARDELIYSDSTEPCPYYEIDGTEVNQDEFNKQINSLITEQLIKRTDWKEI